MRAFDEKTFLIRVTVAFCSYCACASSYYVMGLMDRVDFTNSEAAFGDLRITIDFLDAR